MGSELKKRKTSENSGEKGPWIINAFVMNTPGHQNPGLWSNPTEISSTYKSLKYWTDLAQKLERAKFTGIFIADVLGAYDIYRGPRNSEPALIGGAQIPANDPLLIVPAMAAVTESIGFGVTVSTTYEHPFDLARRFSTLDHLTEGRVGWNIVTPYLENAATNHGLPTQIDKNIRYKRADEYLDVVYKLWEGSWKEGSVILDREANIYTDPKQVRYIDHKGEYFSVSGPHLCEPSRQRTPLLFQAGLSPSGQSFAAQHAEAIFVEGATPADVKKAVNGIRIEAGSLGRESSSIKFVVGMTVIVDETDEKAQAKYESYLSYASLEGALALFGGWLGYDLSQEPDDVGLREIDSPISGFFKTASKSDPSVKWDRKMLAQRLSLGGMSAKIIESVETVVTKLEEWINEAGIDGFNFKYVHMPDTFDDIIKYVLPELRKRGHIADDYAVVGGTLRENISGKKGQTRLRDDHYGHQFVWE